MRPLRPLYNAAKEATINWQGGNTGLWYDKFCNQWCRNPEKHGLEAWTLESFKNKGDNKTSSPKQDWIETVTGKSCGDKDQLEQAVSRLTQLLEYHQQVPLYYKLESDFVTGLGREHPVENGFAWHHTLGTPYLPGSSVKGMVRAWAEIWHKWSEKNEEEMSDEEKEKLKKYKKDKINCIFGSDDSKNPHVGSVIFLDALPTKCVQLKADIMTPHYSDYYAGKKDKQGNLIPPADWHSPTPIPFLVVEKDQSFVFGILPRRKDEQSQKDCEWVKGWLNEALCWTGAGAKTAVGYGRFAPDKEAKRQHAKRLEAQRKEQTILKQTQGKSELYIALFKETIEKRWTEAASKDSFVQNGVIEGWLDKLEADSQADAVHELTKLIDIHFTGLLQNPSAVQGKKAKPVYSDRQKKIAQRLLFLKDKG